MGRPCSVCQHPARGEIDAALAGGEPFRRVAQRFAISEHSVGRHARNHLSSLLAGVQEVVQAAIQPVVEEQTKQGLDVWSTAQQLLARLNLLMDACDQELRDPNDPGRYWLGPRASEIDVVVCEDGKRRVERLDHLLDRVHRESGLRVMPTVHRGKDPRLLLVTAASALTKALVMLGDLLEAAQEAQQRDREGDLSQYTLEELEYLTGRRERPPEGSKFNTRR